MEDKDMVAAIIGALIGALVTGVGLYYRISERDDGESRKIYGAISAVGAAVLVASVVGLVLNLA